MDWMLTNPDRTQDECSAALGYTSAWVSIVASSDLFRAEFARRRKEFEGYHNARLTGKLTALADKALDRQSQLLDPDPITSALPHPRVVLDSANLALKALGYLDPKAPAGGVNVNVNANIDARRVDPQALQEARAIYRALNAGATTIALESKVEDGQSSTAGPLPSAAKL